MLPSPTSDESRKNGFVVPWGWLSLVISMVAITALGTLAVVVKKESTDVLSTIALALAILSFSAQLIIALAQGYNGVLQVSQAGRVNADTRSSLAEIRATSNALLATQREQFSKVLQAALNTAIPAAVGDVTPMEDQEDSDQKESDDASKELEERLFIRLNEALSGQSQAPSTSNLVLGPRRKPSPIYEQLTTYPNEERGKQLLPILNGLAPRDIAKFAQYATTIRDRALEGRPAWVTLSRGPNVAGPTTVDRLIEAGLLTSSDETTTSSGIVRRRVKLTDLGVEVASLILGRGSVPTWLVEA